MAATVLATVSAAQVIASREDNHLTFRIIIFSLYKKILWVDYSLS